MYTELLMKWFPLQSHVVLYGGGLVVQLCLTLMTPWSLPGSSVPGIFQERILEWVAISFFRGPSWTRDQTRVHCIGRWILHH